MSTPSLQDINLLAGADLNPILTAELAALCHKVRYPMKEIINQVKGETLAERARTIGVSRQTMYVWLDERFRPLGPFAKKISKLTGVPVEQIKEYQNDAGRKAAKKTPKLARKRKTASPGDGGTGTRKRRVVAAPGRSKTVRKARGRNSE